MDLIYADENLNDIGVLKDFSFDLAFGNDENDFELTLDRSNHCCGAGYVIYIEGTEYGGIIDKLCVKSKTEEITYKGRTWHGVLENKVLAPDANTDYLTISGEANTILGKLISRLGLDNLFGADTESSGINISSYRFARYVCGYTGIRAMLQSANAKLKVAFKGKKVILSAVPLVDYSKDEQFDTDQMPLDITKVCKGVNHVICLGQGELKDRTVVHLYMDAKGNISQTKQTFTGVDEIMAVYENTSSSNTDELIKGGKEKLEKASSSVSYSLDAEASTYDVGDIVSSKDIVTGISVNAPIVKKIVSIQKEQVDIEYKVGEVR